MAGQGTKAKAAAMTTTDQPQPAACDDDGVIRLDRAARRRLKGLLAAHEGLLRSAAERFAHDLGGVEDITRLQLQVEKSIEELAPHVYTAKLFDWTRYEADMLHFPPTVHPTCGICQAGRTTHASTTLADAA